VLMAASLTCAAAAAAADNMILRYS
jgi:hypothetical protein